MIWGLLAHDFAPAAKLLASAAGLGWSNVEHPGNLLFPLFAQLLGESTKPQMRGLNRMSLRGMELEVMEAMVANPQEPRLVTPRVDALLE